MEPPPVPKSREPLEKGIGVAMREKEGGARGGGRLKSQAGEGPADCRPAEGGERESGREGKFSDIMART